MVVAVAAVVCLTLTITYTGTAQTIVFTECMTSPRTSKARKEAVESGYRSAFEKRIHDQLKKARVTAFYEPRDMIIPYTLKSSGICAVCGSHEVLENHNYLPDFYLPKQNVYIEGKGILTAENRKKMNAVKHQHPDKQIVFIFQKNGKITKRVKYLDWAKKNGFVAYLESENWLERLLNS